MLQGQIEGLLPRAFHSLIVHRDIIDSQLREEGFDARLVNPVAPVCQQVFEINLKCFFPALGY